MTPLEYAMTYAAFGWRVAPIAPGTKYPRVDRWQQLATTDPATIRAWWAETPNDGVSIVTGVDSGLVVIDIDPRHGGDEGWADLEVRYGLAPETVESLTGGGGRHLLFAMPAEHVITNAGAHHLPPGIDVRGEGGQIVAPPTIHPETGRAYAWEVEHDPTDGYAVAELPGWLLALLTRPIPEQTARREPTERPAGSTLPGDLFAAAHTWPDLLEADGWTFHSRRCSHDTGEIYELWTRPGKTPRQGASASLYYRGSDVLKVFTDGAPPLTMNETYTKFGYFAAMRHGGNHAAAARAARRMDNTATGSKIEGTKSPKARPKIVHNGRQLDEVVGDAITALQQHNEPPTMFVRAGQIARLRQDEDERPMIEAVRGEHMRLHLAEAATWWRALKDDGMTATSPPLDVSTSVLAAGAWPLPPLAGVVELPVLRPDGTFATDHGYDPATRLYHWHRGAPYPDVAEQPTPDELANAVALIQEMLTDFPWDTSADRANAWALLLTPLIRAIVGQVPMALVDAPEPGTGKGLLIKIAATITIGRSAGLMAWPTSDEELEKKVTAALMAGNTMMIFDNVEGMVKSPTLAAVLTADSWQGRVLGRSEMVMVPNRATWACTGNNIDVGGDLARRCYRIRLDARQAQPWKRTGFVHSDLEAWVASNRAALLHALCTVVRSWWVAGQPLASSIGAMGGYTSWVRTVGGILDHAGVGDFLANLAEFHADADREAQAWEAFLAGWYELYAEQSVTVADLIAKMTDSQWGHKLRDVLPDELSGYWGSPGFSRRLSLALRKRTGRHFGHDGMHLVAMPTDRRKIAVYAVTTRSLTLDFTTPADDDAVSRDDETSAGVAGVGSPTPREKYLSTGQLGILGVQHPEQLPRLPHSRGPEIDPDYF